MSTKAEQLSEGVLNAIRIGMANVIGDLRSDWEQYAKLIADDALLMAESAAAGKDPEVNLNHLLVQAKTLAAMIALHSEDRVIETLQHILRIVFAVLVPVAKTALLA